MTNKLEISRELGRLAEQLEKLYSNRGWIGAEVVAKELRALLANTDAGITASVAAPVDENAHLPHRVESLSDFLSRGNAAPVVEPVPPLIQTLHANGDRIAMEATIAQQAQRIADLEAAPVVERQDHKSSWEDTFGPDYEHYDLPGSVPKTDRLLSVRDGFCGCGRPLDRQPPAPVAVVLDERAEFIKWVRREWPQAPLSNVRDLLPKDDPRYGEYCDETLQRAWVGWQARACLDKVKELNQSRAS